MIEENVVSVAGVPLILLHRKESKTPYEKQDLIKNRIAAWSKSYYIWLLLQAFSVESFNPRRKVRRFLLRISAQSKKSQVTNSKYIILKFKKNKLHGDLVNHVTP